MDYLIAIGLEVVSGIASLVLISIGLAVVFGMMKVINLAHGEFLMMGGYATIAASKAGINIWIAILVIAPLVVGLVGLVVERLVIRHLYGRVIDTMLATWGLSLLFIGLVTTVFGNTTSGISSPLGAVNIGPIGFSAYKFFIVAVAVAVIVTLYLLFKLSRFGLIARATMQNADMSAALGVDPARVYAATFAIGSALAGLAGGVLAPVTGVVPSIGAAFVAKAFITVIGGGSAVLVGTLSASGIFATVNQLASFATTPVIGEVALLGAAIILLRLFPRGITGRFFKGRI
ncbi:ABC transporter permease subunit [Bradyrhizobium uaiense]|uniref:Branched-chain amino acid ABC transporter permease n=1 Tax=Bradyrhizobium uaiense TaxID=2594946 RepID=A0A6P1BLV4_9BRAD|nr:branched-chain amino acid ABC transporter permease [Bradyrhizobium uaiense]NEU99194.1 branched-chain amino acid ABC transporter permease [Bradyrhizobium uaiense]